MKELLWYLLAGTRGGETRCRIIAAVRARPSNANQLARKLHLDYKTIQHHLAILEQNKIFCVASKGKYAATYLLDEHMVLFLPLFDEIWETFGNK